MIIRQKIAVTGASGQLGQALHSVSDIYPQFQFIFRTSDDLDIRESSALKKFFAQEAPQYFINCAAYTAVDRAEEEKELAYLVNAEAVKIIAELCAEYHTRLIHISTDYVFDGLASSPYMEHAETNPLSVYGASKLKGEEYAMDKNPDAVIIRTSWVYSETGKNFVKTMLRLMQEKDELKIVNDQLGSPTYAKDLARAIMQIISGDHWEPGIYHFSNDAIISWFDFASDIKELTGYSTLLVPVSSEEYKTPARRPLFAVLDKSKIQSVYGISPRDWKDALRECINHLSLKS